MKIWIVQGRTGRWEPTEWFVAAYPDQETAQLHCDKANEVVEHVKKWGEKKCQEANNPWDPFMYIDWYDGPIIAYSLVEINLYRHPDEFLEAETRE